MTINSLWITFFIGYGILGHLINEKYKYNYFNIIQLLFYLIIIICFILFKLIYKKIFVLKELFDNDKSYIMLLDKFLNNLLTSKTLFLSFFFLLFSSTEFIILKILPLNLMGIYLFIIMGFSLFLSMIGYIICSKYILFLRKFSKLKMRSYNRFEPCNTADLKIMSNLMNTFIIGFLSIGLIYVVIYFLVAPISKINTRYIISLSNIAYFSTWLTIFILIIFGFMYIFLYSQSLFKRIINNWKTLTKNDMNYFLKNNSKLNNFDRIDHLNKFLSIISYIDNSPNDVKDSSIYLLSFAFSFSSLFIHFVSLYESLNTVVDVFFNILK